MTVPEEAASSLRWTTWAAVEAAAERSSTSSSRLAASNGATACWWSRRTLHCQGLPRVTRSLASFPACADLIWLADCSEAA